MYLFLAREEAVRTAHTHQKLASLSLVLTLFCRATIRVSLSDLTPCRAGFSLSKASAQARWMYIHAAESRLARLSSVALVINYHTGPLDQSVLKDFIITVTVLYYVYYLYCCTPHSKEDNTMPT